VSKKAKKTNNIGHISLYIISTAFFVIMTAVFPLYVTETHYQNITGDKANFFLMLTILTTIAVLITLFLATKRFQVKDYFVANEPRRPLSIAEWAAVAFILLALLSAIFSPYGNIVWRGGAIGRWEGFWVILCYVLTFFIIGRFYKPRRWHLLIFAASASLLSLYVISQFMGFDILIESEFFINIPEADTAAGHMMLAPLTRTFRGTLGNINIVAVYGGFAAVLFMGLFVGEKSPWGIVYLVSSMLAFSLLLIISRGSDGGRVGTMVATVLMIPYWMSGAGRLGRFLITMAGWIVIFALYTKYMLGLQAALDSENVIFWADYWMAYNFNPIISPTTALIVAAIAAAIGITLIFLKKWPELPMKIAGIVLMILAIIAGIIIIETQGARRYNIPGDMIWEAREMMHGRLEDHFGSNRGFVWRHAMGKTTDRPLLGSGPATFHLAMGQEFQSESRERFGVIFDTAHNVYLNIAITLGIPALAALMVLLAALFIPAAKMAFKRPILIAFMAASLSYLVQGFFQVDTPIDRPLLWIALGVMAGEVWRCKIEKIASESTNHQSKSKK
jgi:hypothetical protein